ncbi:enoyl-CoA hydratase/isomerase family protein [Bacillus sp. Marseille-P3661]|uniref:enoyl-CoA hydratase/isomerase family protein n=1 Tax=Bacillus sp. Marseille-P3661 TaxID=1936234 RepID=UPI000C858134|nr:enoyl-CoA hydratase/isomerase family protein [Bacillus sp. Marseille-P3661]
MSYQTLQYHIKNHVAYLSIGLIPYSYLIDNNFDQLERILNKVERDKDINVVVISFINETIVNSEKTLKNNKNCNQNTKSNDLKANALCSVLKHVSKPVIGVMNGLAISSVLELLLACDLRICSDRAKFAFPEINLATIPNNGGTQYLPKIVGQAAAKELLFFGLMIDANRASAISLVNAVFPDEELIAKTECLAEKLAKKPPTAMRMLKETFNLVSNIELYTDLK